MKIAPDSANDGDPARVTCYLSRVKLESYWKRQSHAAKKPPNDVSQIQIGKDVPEYWKNKVLAKCIEHRRIFESCDSGKPLAVVGGKHIIKLRPGMAEKLASGAVHPARCP